MNDSELRSAYGQLLLERQQSPEQGVNRMGCPSPEALLAVVEHSDAVEVRSQTLAHVSTCRACQQDLNLLRAVRAVRSRLFARIVPMVAAASILLVAGTIFTVRSRTQPEVMRAAEGLTLIAPKELVSAQGSLQFVWAPVSNAESYRLRVIDDQGSTIVDRTARDTTMVVTDLLNAAPGREYVWTVTVLLVSGSERRSEPMTFRIKNTKF